MGLKSLGEGYNESQESLYTLRRIIFNLHEDTVGLLKLLDIYTNNSNSSDSTKEIVTILTKKANSMYTIVEDLYDIVSDLEPGITTSDPDSADQVKELREIMGIPTSMSTHIADAIQGVM